MYRNEEALICDLAETYHIYDYRKWNLSFIATLASGLKDDSRSKMILSGASVTLEQLLLAAIVDRLTVILNGSSREKPVLITDLLSSNPSETIKGFASGKEFEQEKKRLLEEMGLSYG